MDEWLDRVDWPVAVRGAGNGFGILVVSGLVAILLTSLGHEWASVAVWIGFPLGFVVAAWRSGPAPSPVLTGAVAAFFAYTLTIPLIYMSRQGFNLAGIAGTLAVGVLIGGLTGWAMGRREAGAA